MRHFRYISFLLLVTLTIQGWTSAAVAVAASAGPVVVSTYPNDNDPAVPANANLTVRFDEPIQFTNVAGSTAAVTIYRRDDNAVVASYPTLTNRTNLSISGNTLTINPSADLSIASPPNDYYVLISPGAFTSSNGNFAGITNATQWNFTAVSPDNAPPTLLSNVPAAGAANVAAASTTALTLHFSEPVTAAAGSIHLFKDDGSNAELAISVLSSYVTGSGTPDIDVQLGAGLLSGKKYYVTIDSGAFVDMAGNPYAGIPLLNKTAWAFQTSAPAIAQPNLSPANGTINAAPASVVLTMTFDPSLTMNAASSANILVKKLSDNTTVQTISAQNVCVSLSSTGCVAYNANQVQVRLAPLAANTTYYVMVESGAIGAGANRYEGIADASTWRFTTSGASKPTATFTPADGGTLAAVTGTLSLKFNEPVFPDSGTITIRAANGSLYCNIPVTAANVVGGGTNTITITPCTSFVNNAAYSVQISGFAFRNAANQYYDGIAVGDTTTWNFTVTQDQTMPDLASIYPANGATGVRTTGLVLSAVFTEPVDVLPSATADIYRQSNGVQTLAFSAPMTIDPTDPKKVNIAIASALSANTNYFVKIPNNAIADKAGNLFQGILNNYRWTFSTMTNPSAAPAFVSGTLDGNAIILNYDQELLDTSTPLPGQYYVTAGGVPKSVASVKVSGNQVILTLASGVLSGQAVKVSFSSGGLYNTNMVAAADLQNRDITNTADTTLPKPASGTVTGSALTLNFNKPLIPFANSTSAIQSFTVKWNGSSYSPSSVSGSGSTVTMTLPFSAGSSDTVAVSYNAGYATVRDTAGNPAAAFTDFFVQNVIDTQAPVLVSASVANNKLTMTYSEGLKATSVPPAGSFIVLAGGTPASVTSVAIANNTVELTLSQNAAPGASVTVSYIQTSPYLMDLAGNLAATVSSYAVTNTGGTRLSSASVQGSTLTLVFTNTLNASAVPGQSQFYTKVGGAVVNTTNVAVSGSQVVLTLGSAVQSGQTVTVSYLGTGTPLKDTAGQTIAAFTDWPVTNQSSWASALPAYLEQAAGGGLLLKSTAAVASGALSPSGKSGIRYSLDADKLITAYTQMKALGAQVPKQEIVFSVPASESVAMVDIPVRALVDAASRTSNATFRLQYGDLQFVLPVAAVRYTQELQQLGGNAAVASLQLSIDKSAADGNLQRMVSASGATMVTTPADFTATLLSSGGLSREVSEFDQYVERSFTLTSAQSLNPSQLAVVRYDEQTGGLSYVPTRIASVSGGAVVTFLRKSNSVYTVIRKSPTSFTDTAKHWASADIAMLASKFIVDGNAAGRFNPESAITRADFAKFIAKGLGLSGDRSAAARFSDVSVSSDAAAYIGAASKAGIVAGGTDGKFRPNDTITREDMAAMMQRAMTYAGAASGTSILSLSRFQDAGKISAYARTAVAACVDAGVISGMTPTQFSPKNNATRAQAVSMIKRMLEYVEFLP